MRIFRDSLLKARNLTLQGKLMEATRLIQDNLQGTHNTTAAAPAKPVSPETMPHQADEPSARAPVEEAQDIAFREIPWPARPAPPLVTPAASQPSSPTSVSRPTSSFEQASFQFGSDQYRYRVFVPSGGSNDLPVVVMLHGCKQDAADFAQGTAMNALAEREQFIVVYPEQLRKANSMGCWNWFEPAHQSRGTGEPAMIAALASHVTALRGADANRVYIAGLSAGGAMAALAGKLYPDVFAAVGVHSGLAPGAARDVTSAFAAMRSGPGKSAHTSAIGLPVIVIQGSGDKTVAAVNASAITREEVASWAAKGVTLSSMQSEEAPVSGGRASKVVRWTDPAGTAYVEAWSIQAAPHAWAGGDAKGSFTDPKGPSATQAMFRFFAQHTRITGA